MIDVRELLGTTVNGQSASRLQETIKDSTELPRIITLAYYDTDLNGAPSVVESFTVRKGGQTINLSTNVFMKRSEAKIAADRLMLKAWAERTVYRFSLPLDYVQYDPGDVLQLQVSDTRIITVRVIEAVIHPAGFVAFTAVNHDVNAYVGGGSVSDNTPPVVETPVYDTIQFYLVETPPLIHNRNPPDFYICAVKTANFKGGTIYLTKDQVDYTAFGSINSGTFVGTVDITYPPGSGAIRNLSTPLIVRPVAGCTFALTSRTLSDVAAGGNMLYVNGEIVKFQNAELQGDGSWKLTNIWRGCRGTEQQATSSIPSGSLVYFMDKAVPVYTGSTNKTAEYGVKIPVEEAGESVNTVSPKNITMQGKAFRAWAPIRIRYTAGASSAVVKYAYRSARWNDWNGNGEVPVDENGRGIAAVEPGTIEVIDSGNVGDDLTIPITVGSRTFELYQVNTFVPDGDRRSITVSQNRSEFFKD